MTTNHFSAAYTATTTASNELVSHHQLTTPTDAIPAATTAIPDVRTLHVSLQWQPDQANGPVQRQRELLLDGGSGDASGRFSMSTAARQYGWRCEQREPSHARVCPVQNAKVPRRSEAGQGATEQTVPAATAVDGTAETTTAATAANAS